MPVLPFMEKVFYKRNLPHWHPPGASVFLTWRLYGSLPVNAIEKLNQTQRLLRREIVTTDLTDQESRLREYKQLFAKIDASLDKAVYGPLWLKDPFIAGIIEQTVLLRYAELYQLWAYVIMANHIHVFLRPKLINLPGESEPAYASVSVVTKKLKGFTSREANRFLGRAGRPFWQDETFDHWSRDETEFYRIIAYIENNPVKAGLVEKPEDWLWSSAAERKRRGLAGIESLT